MRDDVSAPAWLKRGAGTTALAVHRHTIPRPPEREAWLEARRPFVGASEAAALFGEHPFTTAGDIAARKIEGLEQEQNAAMLRGIALEDAVAGLWAAEHEAELSVPSVLYVAGLEPDVGVLCSTLDREIAGEPAALEVKTTALRTTEPERYWYWQAQAQALCADLERVELAVLDASMELKSYTVRANPADQAELLERAAAFVAHVNAGELPPGATLSKDGVRALYPDPKPGPVELVATVTASGRSLDPRLVVRDLKLARARKKHAEHEVEKLEAILRTQLRDGTEGTLDGRLVVTYRVERYTELDTKRLRAELPEVAEEYARAATRRRMLLK